MIVDRIEHHALYTPLHSRFARAFEFLRQTGLADLAPGRREIDGDLLYATVAGYDTKPASKGVWEAHRRYIDVQYVLDGIERIGYAPLDRLRVTKPYDGEADALFAEGEGSFVTVAAGMFAVLYPHDAHMPGTSVADPAPVRKVVVKVAIDG